MCVNRKGASLGREGGSRRGKKEKRKGSTKTLLIGFFPLRTDSETTVFSQEPAADRPIA